MTVTEEVKAGQLTELLKEVQAGNEVLLTQDNKLSPSWCLLSLIEQHRWLGFRFVLSKDTKF
jgi:hypothetical protein